MKIFCFTVSVSLFLSCGETIQNQENTTQEQPAFCDCVNKDYHKQGDKEACDKIEKELEKKLKNASVEEKGEILIKIQDCKVQGQYDND